MSLLKTILEKRKKLKGEDPCWDNYKMVGLKPNGDPNCVGPVKETTSMQHAEMVTINSPGHHLHNTSARVFYKHDDGRVNVQVTHSKKKGHVTNLSLKPSQFVKGVVNLDKQVKEDTQELEEAKATYCGRCGTTHVAPKFGGKCPALEEEQVNEITMSPEDEKRNNQDYGKRATKLLKHSWAQHDVSTEKRKAGDKEGAEKAAAAGSRAHKLFLKARDRHQERQTPEQRTARIHRMMSGANDYYRSKKPGQYTGDSFDPTLTRDTPAIAEATSAAVRMQRALQKAKDERERQERLAKPFVDKVFGNKEKEMKKLSTIREEAEQKVHPNALHVKQVKVDGKTKYHVHAVGKNFSDGIKVGEHLSDSELDDFSEMGGKVKHVK